MSVNINKYVKYTSCIKITEKQWNTPKLCIRILIEIYLI